MCAHNSLILYLLFFQVIKHNNFINEDPCYNVLLAYVQYEYASIGKIIEALNLMGRIDVLSRIKNSINGNCSDIINLDFNIFNQKNFLFHLLDLTDLILNCNSNLNNNSTEDASDYGSLPVSEGNFKKEFFVFFELSKMENFFS